MVEIKDDVVITVQRQFAVGAFTTQVANHGNFSIAPPALRKLIKALLTIRALAASTVVLIIKVAYV
jgi:hypothetical protein